MTKNYYVLHYIQNQMKDFPYALQNAIQRLFQYEDNRKECQGCVIESVVIKLLFAKFGFNTIVHLGELFVNEKQSFYHCWLTFDNKIIDLGIYGNTNYNPFYKGPLYKTPIILEEANNMNYMDGSTENESWLASLSGLSFKDYLKNNPNKNTIYKMYCYALDITLNKGNIDELYTLSSNMTFPLLKYIPTKE